MSDLIPFPDTSEPEKTPIGRICAALNELLGIAEAMMEHSPDLAKPLVEIVEKASAALDELAGEGES